MAARHLLLLLGLTACSLTLSGPDPNRPRTKMPVCDTSKSLVALDGVMGTAMAVTAIAVVSNNNGTAAVIPALLSALYVGSAIHGNSAVDACHREMDSYDQTMAARDVVPPIRPAVMPPSLTPPVMAPPPVAPPPAAEPTPAPPPVRDQWSAFWREVP